MTDSQTLLVEYAKTGSEPAFRELVARYVDFVYSAAVRLVNGDTHLAEDVTQTVFVDLARKARTFSAGVMLGGWLHRHTCFVAANTLRGERRRQHRERQAVEMKALHDQTETGLAQVAPILDEAINQLGAEDRTAILLRFFEQRDLRSVGEALGSSENAAQKRVARALEELRGLLKHRGVTFSAAALAAALTTEAVSAAPAALAAGITSTALANSAIGGVTTLALIKIITMTKLKLGIIAAIVVIAAAATTWVVTHQPEKPPVFSGYGTPEASLQTLQWALNSGDKTAILTCFTPEYQKKLISEYQRTPQAGLKSAIGQQALLKKGARIAAREAVSDDEIIIMLSNRKQADNPRMKRIGGEWKFDGPAGN